MLNLFQHLYENIALRCMQASNSVRSRPKNDILCRFYPKGTDTTPQQVQGGEVFYKSYCINTFL